MRPKLRTILQGAALAGVLLGLVACDRAPGGPAPGQSGAALEPASAFAAPDLDPDSLGPPADAATKAFYEGDFEAFGVEPTWQLDLLQDYATFERPGLDQVAGLPQPRDVRVNGALVDVGSGAFTVILRAGACVHTSGETLPYVATVVFEGVGYRGCARRMQEGGGATPAWSALAGELLPVIDQCLARLTSRPGRVTIAYLLNQDQTNVRMLDADGGRYECGVETATGQIVYFEAIADRDVIGGEREPLFTRAPNPPPEGACFENTVLNGADGAQIGWLTRRKC